MEQRAKEGTAKELIVQIGIEKEQLIGEGKIRKENPLLKITEEDCFFDIKLPEETRPIGKWEAYVPVLSGAG